MLGSGVSQRVDDCGLPKTGSTEFIEECTCILCTGDSREPVGATGLEAFRQRRLKNQLCAKHLTGWTDHAAEFAEDSLAKRVEIEDSVHQRDINT